MSRRPALIALLVLALGLIAAPSVSAYTTQIPGNVTITGPLGTITCGQPYTLTATVFDTNGNKISGQAVNWTEISKPLTASDTDAPANTTTNGNGQAQTTVTFGPPDGSRTIRATAGNAFADIVLNVTGCQGTPPPVKVTIGTCESALGLDPAGGYTQGTKVQSLHHYITFRLSFGPAYANKPIVVTHAFRQLPPGSGWGTFLGATTRIADANGDVFYHFRSSGPAWISVRGFYPGSNGLAPAITTACQGRWR